MGDDAAPLDSALDDVAGDTRRDPPYPPGGRRLADLHHRRAAIGGSTP